MNLDPLYQRLKSWLLTHFLILCLVGFAIRFLFIIYYYFEGFGLVEGFYYGDVEYNWEDVEDLTSGQYQSYPPLALLLLIVFKFLSFGNLKIFMIWAGLLEIGLVLAVWAGMKDLLITKNDPSTYEPVRWALLLLLFNPFWFLHNIFSVSNCGYHYTDYFFLYAFLGAIIFYQQKKENLAFICLGLSAAIKWFTLPAIGFYPLLLLLNKDYRRFWRFIVIEGFILLAFLVLPLFIIPNYLELYLFYLQGGGNPIFEWVPFYIKLIPILCLSIYFLAFRLKKSDFLAISAWAMLIMFSFMLFARFYLRYLLGWILLGHLMVAAKDWAFEIKLLGVKLNQHEFTFLLSVIGTLLTILLLFFQLV
jgi:hypothetical protein